ncbi:MAG TPA: lysophospholipid acyltransferase family protein [Spirochaetota bacterium]|nr:lysophospholipid acyltransferase family protein [Spirochaetota bacterium]
MDDKYTHFGGPIPAKAGVPEGKVRKFLVVLYQPYKWLVYIPFLVLSTLVFGAIAVILSTLVNQRIGSYIGGAVWSRLNGYMTPISVKVIGKENIDKRQSYVIVPNHQSHFDIFVLYGWLGIDFKWVLKQELRKVPGLGIGCEKVGHIFIDRSNHEKAIASINAARKKIVDGTSVIFFPEGTRQTSGKLGDFKKGAFKFAIDMGLPLLPVTIINTRNILPAHTMNLLPGKAIMVVHPKIDTTGHNDANIEELMQKVRSALQSGLDAHQ